jgi:lysozyme
VCDETHEYYRIGPTTVFKTFYLSENIGLKNSFAFNSEFPMMGSHQLSMPAENLMANFTYSPNGLTLTKRFEGLELTAYQDQVGVWTIGYGHTGPTVHGGLTITQTQADQLLESDVSGAVACVNRAVTTAINQNQFDALVDFVINLGCASLLTSMLLRFVNKGDFADAALQFLRWDHAGGVVIPGLLKRRQAEMELFRTPQGEKPAPTSGAGFQTEAKE